MNYAILFIFVAMLGVASYAVGRASNSKAGLAESIRTGNAGLGLVFLLLGVGGIFAGAVTIEREAEMLVYSDSYMQSLVDSGYSDREVYTLVLQDISKFRDVSLYEESQRPTGIGHALDGVVHVAELAEIAPLLTLVLGQSEDASTWVAGITESVQEMSQDYKDKRANLYHDDPIKLLTKKERDAHKRAMKQWEHAKIKRVPDTLTP